MVKFMRAFLFLAIGIALTGCDSSDSSDSSGSSGGSSASSSDSGSGAALSGVEREARDTAMAEIAKHWTKGADGWTSAKKTGSPFAPELILQQYRELTVEGVEAYSLSESDKLNGFEWAGEVSFKRGPAREAGGDNLAFDGMAGMNIYRKKGQWSQWVDYGPESMQVQKNKGKWQVSQDHTLLSGTIPTPEDYASAGVK